MVRTLLRRCQDALPEFGSDAKANISTQPRSGARSGNSVWPIHIGSTYSRCWCAPYVDALTASLTVYLCGK